MRIISRKRLAIAAFVGLAAGVAYVAFGTGGATRTPTVVIVPTARGAGIELSFPEAMVQWQPECAGDFEVLTAGSHDFWFKNNNAVPITLAVNYKSCKCSQLFVCLLSREDTEHFPLQAAASGAAVIGAAYQGVTGLLGLFRDTDRSTGWLGAKMHWQPISANDPALTIDPQCGGFFRVTFKGEKVNTERLAINLWSQPQTESPHPPSEYRLEIPVKFVPVLQVSQPEITMGELRSGEEKTKDFICWSSTRASFPLHAKESSNDPCFNYSCTPLTNDECIKAAGLLKARVLAGYHVKVSVRESTPSGGQLDWGPFSRKLILTSDADIEQTIVEVNGRVVGDVVVGVEADEGEIALGQFAAKSGTTKTIRLKSVQSGADLQFDRIEPPHLDYLKVKTLTKATADGRDWDLCVEAVPGGPPGKLPKLGAIIVKVQGKNPRNLRIPVRGLAFR